MLFVGNRQRHGFFKRFPDSALVATAEQFLYGKASWFVQATGTALALLGADACHPLPDRMYMWPLGDKRKVAMTMPATQHSLPGQAAGSGMLCV